MNNKIKLFNLIPDSGLQKAVELQTDGFNSWKIDFHPNGSEIVTGALSMTAFDVDSGMKIQEFGKGSKYIHSVTYASNGRLCASGN